MYAIECLSQVHSTKTHILGQDSYPTDMAFAPDGAHACLLLDFPSCLPRCIVFACFFPPRPRFSLPIGIDHVLDFEESPVSTPDVVERLWSPLEPAMFSSLLFRFRSRSSSSALFLALIDCFRCSLLPPPPEVNSTLILLPSSRE